MDDWQVVKEARDLSEKLGKLNVFLADDGKLMHLTNKAVALLKAQSHAMTNYLDILDRRIASFGKEPQ